MDALRSIAFIIAVCLICLCVPVAIVIIAKYPESASEYSTWLRAAAIAWVFASVLLGGWRLKRGLKSRMNRGLGREVKDHELTSIATWMEIPDQAARASREAERYDFDRE